MSGWNEIESVERCCCHHHHRRIIIVIIFSSNGTSTSIIPTGFFAHVLELAAAREIDRDCMATPWDGIFFLLQGLVGGGYIGGLPVVPNPPREEEQEQGQPPQDAPQSEVFLVLGSNNNNNNGNGNGNSNNSNNKRPPRIG